MKPVDPDWKKKSRECLDCGGGFSDTDPDDVRDHEMRHQWFDHVEQTIGKPLAFGEQLEKQKSAGHALRQKGKPDNERLQGSIIVATAHYERDVGKMLPGKVPSIKDWALSRPLEEDYGNEDGARLRKHFEALNVPASAQPEWTGHYCWACRISYDLFSPIGSAHAGHDD